MKKILLLAYTNCNFGDDMFIYTICKAFPEQNFVLHAPLVYKTIFKNISNLTVTETGIISKVFNKLLNTFPVLYRFNINTWPYKAVVYVVGGLFDEDKTWENNVNKYGIKRLKNIIWKNSFDSRTPFFLLGCNVTRVLSQNYINQMQYLFYELKDICFRDRYSYNFFKNLQNTRYAPDIVFNYDCKITEKEDYIVISVWGPLTCTKDFPQWQWAEGLWKPYKEFMINIAKSFVQMGKRVILLALCENEGDLIASNIIREEGKLDANIVTYRGNLDEIIGLFEKSSFIVGARFHSIIMALNAKCAVYPIVYESKTQQLIKDIEYHGEYAHIENPQNYSVEKVIQSYKQHVCISCEAIKQEAKKQFQALKLFLEH